MQTIVVASHNPVKIKAVQNGFQRIFPATPFTIHPVAVASGVPDQPRNDIETRQGAINRSANARVQLPQADYWVGVEGGIEDYGSEMWAFAWVAIHSQQRLSQARTGMFALPPGIADLVRQGIELGEADDIIFGRSNSKQEDGAVGILTAGAIDRAMYYTEAVILALIPFKNPDLYP